jgi:hypothetical protein
MTEQEKIITKVQKLLSNANDSATTPEEAQAFMLKAQALMAKHNLSATDIASDCDAKNVVEDTPIDYMRMPFWYGQLASIIGHNFKCYTFIRTGKGKKKIMFVGLEEDVDLAKEVFNYATEYLKHKIELVKVTLKFKKHDTIYVNGYVNEFVLGFMSGLSQQFADQVKNNEWGLVIVKDPTVEEKWADLQKILKSKSSGKIRTAGGEEAFSKGFEEGNNFSKPSGLITEG